LKKITYLLSLFFICISLISCGEVRENDAPQNQEITQTDKFVGTVHYTWNSDTYKNRIKIKGTVRNDTPIEQTHVMMRLRVKDANYNFLGEDTVYLDPMLSGEESVFTSYIFDSTCPTSELRLYYAFE
jgi:hypothetical protein